MEHKMNISEEELIKLAKEIFGDVDKFWKGLHPSVQRLVLKVTNEDHFNWNEREDAENKLKEAGLTKEDVEFKPKIYNVGGFEIKIDI